MEFILIIIIFTSAEEVVQQQKTKIMKSNIKKAFGVIVFTLFMTATNTLFSQTAETGKKLCGHKNICAMRLM